MRRIAVIGFGFSGFLTVANLVRKSTAPLCLYIIDEHADGLGVAYGTDNPDHLLNVRAGSMSAFAEAPDDLMHWLKTEDAAFAKASLGAGPEFTAMDFIPRALYGSYLVSIWRDTQALAAQKKLQLKLVPSRAVACQQSPELAVLTARGDAIALDAIVLAVGHETKAILPQIASERILQDPWVEGAFTDAASWASPVLLMGTSLTAIDVLLSLRRAGYQGEVLMTSRRGYLPQRHAMPTAIFNFSADDMAAARSLRQMLGLVRSKIAVTQDWRIVVDALRPHTQALWQRLSTREQQRFLRLLAPLWGVHRHRMAGQIAAAVEREIAAQSLRIICSKTMEVRVEEGALQVAIGDEQFSPSRIINCTGLELDLARSANPLLKQILAGGMVEPHATKLGVAADKYHRAWGHLHGQLYVLGSLLTGQLLESTAVPELREQAAAIAERLLSDA